MIDSEIETKDVSCLQSDPIQTQLKKASELLNEHCSSLQERTICRNRTCVDCNLNKAMSIIEKLEAC